MDLHRLENTWLLMASFSIGLSGFAALANTNQCNGSEVIDELIVEEGANNKLFVQVRINESAPLWFVVDTGAPTTHVDYGCAKRLGLTLKNVRKKRVGAGTGQMLISAETRDVTFGVSGQQFSCDNVSVLELQHVAELMGRRVDGLLGNDFIRNYSFEIDYQERRIRLYNASEFQYGGSGQTVPIDLSSGRPAVSARIGVDNRELDLKNLIVDTGANASLYLCQPVVERHGLLSERQDAVAGVFSRGAGGDARGAVVRIDHANLGAVRICEPVVIFAEDKSGFFASKHFGGIVGGELLRRSKVIFDYSQSRMILDSYELTTPIRYDNSGMLIRSLSPTFKEFEVISVLERTPAAEAGVRAGDRLATVDGQSAEVLTLVEINKMLKQSEGTRIRFSLRRKGQRVDVELVLRDFTR